MLRSIKVAGLALAMTLASAGFAAAQDGYHYYDRDDHYGYNNRYGYNDSGLRIARSTGYDDGSRVAYSDLRHYKPFNPYPRGKYAHEDHGYHHEYGDKYAYRAEYDRGYRTGYAETFRRR